MLLLIDNNFGEDAAILQRSLCEIWIKFLHSEDFNEIDSWLYLRQKGIHRLKTLGEWRKSVGGKLSNDYDYMHEEMGDEQRVKKVIEHIKKMNPNLGQLLENDLAENSGLNITKNKNEFWPKKSLIDLLSDANKNVKWIYGLGFDIPSSVLHSNPGILEMYVESDGSTVNPRNETHTNFRFEDITRFAAGWLIDILYSFEKSWLLNRKQEIEPIREEFQKVFSIANS
jgi:hypothetical protein